MSVSWLRSMEDADDPDLDDQGRPRPSASPAAASAPRQPTGAPATPSTLPALAVAVAGMAGRRQKPVRLNLNPSGEVSAATIASAPCPPTWKLSAAATRSTCADGVTEFRSADSTTACPSAP